MSQITTTNRTSKNIDFINYDKGSGNDNELVFKLGEFEVNIIKSDDSIEIIIEENKKDEDNEEKEEADNN